MAATTNVNATTITRHTNFANVYVGCTVPADFTPFTHTSGDPAGGTFVGATQGGATVSFKPNIALVDIDQAYGGIVPHMQSETMTMSTVLLEMTAANILLLSQQGTATTNGSNDIVQLGGRTDVPTTCIAVMSKHADSTKYFGAMLYKCAVMDGLTLGFMRGMERKPALNATAIAVQSRSAGDQFGQLTPTM